MVIIKTHENDDDDNDDDDDDKDDTKGQDLITCHLSIVVISKAIYWLVEPCSYPCWSVYTESHKNKFLAKANQIFCYLTLLKQT